ncbi:MAG: hypothetical protein O0V67_08540 [Methanocorpusculum sp.]|nr:hypothetical protein [Methanocorpusculum sp.]
MASLDFLKGTVITTCNIKQLDRTIGYKDKNPNFMHKGGCLVINDTRVSTVIWKDNYVTYAPLVEDILVSFSFEGCSMAIYTHEAKQYGAHIHDGIITTDRKKDFIDFVFRNGIFDCVVFEPIHFSLVFNQYKVKHPEKLVTWGVVLEKKYCYSVILETLDSYNTQYRTACILKHASYDIRRETFRNLMHYGLSPQRSNNQSLTQYEFHELYARWHRVLEYEVKVPTIIYIDSEYASLLQKPLRYPIIKCNR